MKTEWLQMSKETSKYEDDSEGATDESINDDGSIDASEEDPADIPADDTFMPAESDTTGF